MRQAYVFSMVECARIPLLSLLLARPQFFEVPTTGVGAALDREHLYLKAV